MDPLQLYQQYLLWSFRTIHYEKKTLHKADRVVLINYCLHQIEGVEMKYKDGDIVCLFDGRTVYVFAVDYKSKRYQVSNTDGEGTLSTIKENEIFMKIV